MRDCSIFNNSSIRAAAKLKYKPKIVDGNPVKVDNVLYRFRYEMEDSNWYRQTPNRAQRLTDRVEKQMIKEIPA